MDGCRTVCRIWKCAFRGDDSRMSVVIGGAGVGMRRRGPYLRLEVEHVGSKEYVTEAEVKRWGRVVGSWKQFGMVVDRALRC